MATQKPSRKPAKPTEPEPFNKRKVNPAKFPSDLPLKDLKELFEPVSGWRNVGFFVFPIEILSPVKTVGRGRTNLTLIRPTIVQVDADTGNGAKPYAGFDRRESPTRNPAVSMHFEPKAYGITAVSTYVMVFSIEVIGQASTFDLSGFAGGGTVANSGSRTLSGQTTVSLVLRNVPPSAEVWGAITQKAGGQWNWYTVQARYPALVVKA
jgi:hypothetical protein